MNSYIGRFAPSPTGLLHAGSLVAALASWLDARAHGGEWRVRIEDTDTPRCVAGAGEAILGQLARCGLLPDGEVWWQSQRGEAYAQALQQLVDAQLAYPCGCSRQDIQAALAAQGALPPRHGERVYPGTCRSGLHGKPARAWRLRCDRPAEASGGLIAWHDRLLGAQSQQLCAEVGDFVLKRADGLWAYQLAVVVDDAAQQITDVVRGEDLADNTPRQIHLQRALGLPTPRYLHTPLVLAEDGQKLSKQTGALALALGNEEEALRALRQAADALGLPALAADPPTPAGDRVTPARMAAWREQAVAAWAARVSVPAQPRA